MAKALIVYTSLTGNTQACSDIVADALEELGVEVDVVEVYDADVTDFENYDACLVGCYSYGDYGELPYEIMDFWEELPELDLTGKVYGVFGSGDTFYEPYCGAVDDFMDAFSKTGATKADEGVRVNLYPEDEDVENLQNLAKAIFDKLK